MLGTAVGSGNRHKGVFERLLEIHGYTGNGRIQVMYRQIRISLGIMFGTAIVG